MAKRSGRADYSAFENGTVPDVIGPGLRVLFCGINPSLSSAAHERHFATPGNRFWPALHRGGFTPRVLDPSENAALLDFGLGVTNLVARATRGANDLDAGEYAAGVAELESKCRRFEPRVVAVLGVGAYRAGFGDRKATLGPQDRTLGPSRLYVLPNPSGLNAHYTPATLGDLFADLRRFAENLTA